MYLSIGVIASQGLPSSAYMRDVLKNTSPNKLLWIVIKKLYGV